MLLRLKCNLVQCIVHESKLLLLCCLLNPVHHVLSAAEDSQCFILTSNFVIFSHSVIAVNS